MTPPLPFLLPWCWTGYLLADFSSYCTTAFLPSTLLHCLCWQKECFLCWREGHKGRLHHTRGQMQSGDWHKPWRAHNKVGYISQGWLDLAIDICPSPYCHFHCVVATVWIQILHGFGERRLPALTQTKSTTAANKIHWPRDRSFYGPAWLFFQWEGARSEQVKPTNLVLYQNCAWT